MYFFTAYTFGSGDYQRHTQTTMTYKMQSHMDVTLAANYWVYSRNMQMYWWLVYDKTPTGTLPTTSQIFDTLYKERHVTWMVNRDVCHRFVVKKKWTTSLSSNGVSADKINETVCALAKQSVNQVKLFKRLGVKTEWKNTTTGEIGDVKAGALYLVGAPTDGFKINLYGRFRMYFKSVGNQ
uniref:Capsid protein n=1 Tax=Pteris mastrevirus A TaxID=2809268 RepID=A0A890CB31_9GEMI|nr:CP [Pteris mastrevirus A]